MNAIMTAWQCGGQGFESPQLYPYDQGVLLREGGLSRSGASGRRPFRFLHPVRAGDHTESSAVGCLAEIADEA